MKKLTGIINCIYNSIKKYFFNSAKNDISHDCEDVPVIGNFVNDAIQNDNEEYLENYTSTTRWQTL